MLHHKERPMRTALAHFLRHIPQSNQPPAALASLLPPDADPALVCALEGFVVALQWLGAVERTESGVRASSQTAKYTLNSLAAFVEAQAPLIADWHTRGLQPHPLANGATFLRLMEERRLQLNAEAEPSRVERVAQVLIKRTESATGRPQLLFQYDGNASQFQLIGGRYSPRDASEDSTITREIMEELPLNTLHHGVDYTLVTLLSQAELPLVVSPTFGALTRYVFTVYLMQGLRGELRLGPHDRWLYVDDVLANRITTESGEASPFLDLALYHTLDERSGGLHNLPDSFG
jgi:hypothetical protein